jgi:hypothetical protein
MFNVKVDNLRQEIKIAEEFRNKHLEGPEEIKKRYVGRYHRKDRQPNIAVAENHAYEYASVIAPSLMYDPPKVVCTAKNPEAGGGEMSMGMMATGIQLSLNRWAEDADATETLRELLLDFLFTWAAALVVEGNQPGYEGVELAPTRPYLLRIPNRHFFLDPNAMTNSPMANNGPRYMGHMWSADVEDLLKDEDYDSNTVKLLAVDSDMEKYNPERNSGLTVPKRREILGYDIWVPEVAAETSEPGYNGTIFTIGLGNDPDGTTKKARYLRSPRPAYCPPWGPYVMYGAHKVIDSPYFMSPLVAVAEQAEEVNLHVATAADDAKSFKRFAVAPSQNRADGERIVTVRNGQLILLDSTEGINEMTIGGVSDAQYKYIDAARERLNRTSGLTDALRGEVRSNVTATESAIANAGTNVRIDGLKRTHRSAVERILKSVAWYMFHSDQFESGLGEEGVKAGMSDFQGGLSGERADFNFFDMSLSIEPYSMEHTDQVLLQRRIEQAWGKTLEAIQIMQQAPFVKWREPLRLIWEVLDIGNADEWIDFDALEDSQQRQAQNERMQAEGQTGSGGGGAAELQLAGGGAGLGETGGGGDIQNPIATANETGGVMAETYGGA